MAAKNKEKAKGIMPEEKPAKQSEGQPEAAKLMQEAIGEEQVKKFGEILQKYREGKANLDNRIVANEEWFRLRQWRQMETAADRSNKAAEPASAWLFNCITSKHADAMDSFPEPNILPRESDDREEAARLSSIVPVVLEQAEFEKAYDRAWYKKLKGGTGVYGVFWDSTKLNGLGDVSVQAIDVLSLYWKPGIDDIQDSPFFFHVKLMDNEEIKAMYPQVGDKLGKHEELVKKYMYDDTVDTSNMSQVVDVYYKKMAGGKKVLHYCKYVDDMVLYASENDTDIPTKLAADPETGELVEVAAGLSVAETGWYEHGMYPFVFDACFPCEGTPAGFSFVDVCRSPQEYIDRLDQAVLENSVIAARPRYFFREDGQINEKEFVDFTKTIVHVQGAIDETTAVPIAYKPLPSYVLNVLDSKINELKETSHNRDVNNGGSVSGVTAASAIAAMQEQSGKQSRDMIKSSYRCMRDIYIMVIELIRQFYSLPRQFRITGRQGEEQYITYSNQMLVKQQLDTTYPDGTEMYRLPVFDVEVNAQKESPYNKTAYNEFALQLYGQGFFNPQMADQALAALDVMEFKGKNDVMQKIQQNGTLLQMVQQLQQIALQMALRYGDPMAQQLAAMQGIQLPATQNAPGGSSANISADSLGNVQKQEHGTVRKARAEAQATTQPR